MLPSAADLTYFLEVSSTGNLSRAAERLGISQPSLSLSVQRLEEGVGTPLLIRSKKGVALTQAGKRLLAQARFLLEEWEKVREQAGKSRSEVAGSYTVGCHPSVALYSLPPFLPKLMEEHPDLEIRLEHDLSRKITEGIVSLRIDLGVVVNPNRHPDLVLKKLCEDKVTLWNSPGSRGVQDPRSGKGTLICDPELLQTQTLLKKLRKCGILHNRVLQSSNLELIANLVAAGAGFGILPGRVALRDPSLGLKTLRDAPVLSDEICLAYRVENRDVRAVQAISAAISAAFA